MACTFHEGHVVNHIHADIDISSIIQTLNVSVFQFLDRTGMYWCIIKQCISVKKAFQISSNFYENLGPIFVQKELHYGSNLAVELFVRPSELFEKYVFIHNLGFNKPAVKLSSTDLSLPRSIWTEEM